MVEPDSLKETTCSGPLLIRLLSGKNVPSLDSFSESDVFVEAELVTKRKEVVANRSSSEVVATARWPVKWDASDPLWDSGRLFGSEPPPKDAVLRLAFYDLDENIGNANDYIGTADVSVASLGLDRDVVVPFTTSHRHLNAVRRACVVLRE